MNVRKRTDVNCEAIFVLCGLLLISNLSQLAACPFCPGPSTTLSEQLAQADVALLGQWSNSAAGTFQKTGRTSFVITEVLQQPLKSNLKAGNLITLSRHYAGKPGELFLLTGTRGISLHWNEPIAVTSASIHYLKQAPAQKAETTARLRYFLKYLEHPDQIIANDAFAEFANAPFETVTPLAEELPREKLRSWLENENTPVPRLGLYGLLLGLCGQESDSQFMEAKIRIPAQEIRMGIGGLMSGYLLLTGSVGLDKIDETKFKDKTAAFSETFAGMQALSFMWTFGEDKIEKRRLNRSMRILLERPELADLVIANLARWEDWTVMERLVELYAAEDYDVRSVKKAIIRYLLLASLVPPTKAGGNDVETSRKAKQFLELLRLTDPQTIQSAERFFHPPR
ncbi:hypothetical protein [Gimesia algae]|uniref:HEAT repeat domain-containing protein n=1 Tax=Gimesia algae TaxID=2527971 RepID=A0A517V6Q5_9PLAN|nr:hypothetical protein [Gimesia algae]QDT88686.1 hypothetical protein Pan161_03040 [Gimesia algae]